MDKIVLYKKHKSGTVSIISLNDGLNFKVYDDNRHSIGVHIIEDTGKHIFSVNPYMEAFYDEYRKCKCESFFHQIIEPMVLKCTTDFVIATINSEECEYVDLGELEEQIARMFADNQKELLEHLYCWV